MVGTGIMIVTGTLVRDGAVDRTEITISKWAVIRTGFSGK